MYRFEGQDVFGLAEATGWDGMEANVTWASERFPGAIEKFTGKLQACRSYHDERSTITATIDAESCDEDTYAAVEAFAAERGIRRIY